MYYEDLKMCECATNDSPPITAYHDEFGYCGIVKHFNEQGGMSYIEAPSSTSAIKISANARTWIHMSTSEISENQTDFSKTSDTVIMTSDIAGVANGGWNFTNKITITGGGILYFDTSKLTPDTMYSIILIGDISNSVRCSFEINGKPVRSVFLIPQNNSAVFQFNNALNDEYPNLRCLKMIFPESFNGTYNIRAVAYSDPEVINLTGGSISTSSLKDDTIWWYHQSVQVRYPILSRYAGNCLIFNAHGEYQYPAKIYDIGLYRYARITGQVVNTSANASANFSSVAMITYDANNARWIISTSVSASGLSFNINVYADHTGALINAEITGLSSGFVVDLYQIEVG